MRLTVTGWRVAALSPLLLVAAYLLGYPRLAVLGVGGLAAIGAGGLWVAVRPTVGMSREIFPNRVRRGEPAVGMLMISNGSRFVPLRIEARETFGGEELAIPVPYLRPGASREIGYQLPTGRRGVIEVGPLRWERTDLLGLVRRRESLAGTQLLYVHPAVHPFPLSAALRAQRWDSSTTDAAPDGTITFHTLREYVAGDDLRFIHWRTSARLDTLMVRRNIDVSLPMTTMLLVTDAAAYPDPDLFEEAVEIAASTVVAAAAERLPARLVTSAGQVLTGSGGHDDAGRFLDFLAGVKLAGQGGVGQAADKLDRAEGGGVLVLATGTLHGDDLVIAHRLAARYDEAVVAMLSANPAGQDAVTIAHADPGVSVLAVGSGAQFCARWAELARR